MVLGYLLLVKEYNIKESFKITQWTDKEYILLTIIIYMKVVFKMDLFVAKENVCGKMERNMKDNGKIIKWMAKVLYIVRMEKNILVLIFFLFVFLNIFSSIKRKFY